MKRVKVENSTLWFDAVYAPSLVPAKAARRRPGESSESSDLAPFRDELSLPERAKVAEEWSDALLCCTHSRSRRIVRGFA